ncbi:hypothetical protein PM082_002342 [Marasmius tenuissimus]|nr:hypothetical protein PM082_002342 [Marasmius tenuissimus]
MDYPIISTPSTTSSAVRHGIGLSPLSRPQANGYTPAHSQYAAQSSRYRSAAYAETRDLLTVAVAILYQTFRKKDLTELHKLSDVIKEFDACCSIAKICHIVVELALKKLMRHAQELAPGLEFEWDTKGFNHHDVMRVKGKQVGVGIDLDEPTVEEYGPSCPYLMLYGDISGKDKKWKPTRSYVSF